MKAKLLGVLGLALLLPGTARMQAAPPDLGVVWKDFTQNDDEGSKKAWQGMRAMIQAPQLAVPFLKERVKPVAHADQKRIDQCLADLDALARLAPIANQPCPLCGGPVCADCGKALVTLLPVPTTSPGRDGKVSGDDG